ncbi:P-type DNA transfer protein VirB5 [Iodobacter fluviatilis]|uniref:P-type DNA transfer protein VirB5 n=1 Tax=Iodobacter fluviatilis TaxID=537 RepID=A0A7G3GFJ7_9NEIS|nr:P-type DNA transfer protein VirB5 [Iodobacter fluviatilis]QBC45839.1 P-type DNA transfer protein VirB5 [Iodobacter fluviatilis]QBC45892.1 P-type DNA transfer protein VirB5 [Iodobacter fluviatilis]
MKKSLISLVLVAAFATQHANATGIPVVDVANLAQTVQQVITAADQLAQMKSQLDQMKQQYDAISGMRGLGDIFNDPALRDALPSDWRQVYDGVKNGKYQGISGTAKAIKDANRIFGCDQQGLTGNRLALCQEQEARNAQNRDLANQAYDAASKRIDQITQLGKQINTTSDPKAIAELQARITNEMNAIQNEQTKLQLMKQIADIEKETYRQRQREAKIQDGRKQVVVQSVQPLTVQ